VLLGHDLGEPSAEAGWVAVGPLRLAQHGVVDEVDPGLVRVQEVPAAGDRSEAARVE